MAKVALQGEYVQATPPIELIVRPRFLSLFALSRSVKGIGGFSPCSVTVHTKTEEYKIICEGRLENLASVRRYVLCDLPLLRGAPVSGSGFVDKARQLFQPLD